MLRLYPGYAKPKICEYLAYSVLGSDLRRSKAEPRAMNQGIARQQQTPREPIRFLFLFLIVTTHHQCTVMREDDSSRLVVQDYVSEFVHDVTCLAA